MSFSSLSKLCPKYKEYLNHNTAQGCVKDLAAKHHGKKLYSFVKDSLEDSTWKQNAQIKEVVDQAFSYADSHKLGHSYKGKCSKKHEKKENLNEKFKELFSKYQKEASQSEKAKDEQKLLEIKQAQEKSAQEKAAQEKAAQEKLTQEKLAQEQKEKAEKEKAAQEAKEKAEKEAREKGKEEKKPAETKEASCQTDPIEPEVREVVKEQVVYLPEPSSWENARESRLRSKDALHQDSSTNT